MVCMVSGESFSCVSSRSWQVLTKITKNVRRTSLQSYGKFNVSSIKAYLNHLCMIAVAMEISLPFPNYLEIMFSVSAISGILFD